MADAPKPKPTDISDALFEPVAKPHPPAPVYEPPPPTADLPVDITDHVRSRGVLTGADENPEDTVWEWRGHRVKLKTFYDPNSQHGMETFRISGAMVGADGKAIRRDNSEMLAIYGLPHGLTVHSQNPAMTEDPQKALTEALTAARQRCVMDTVRAHGVHRAGSQLSGVAPMKPKVGPEPYPLGALRGLSIEGNR